MTMPLFNNIDTPERQLIGYHTLTQWLSSVYSTIMLDSEGTLLMQKYPQRSSEGTAVR